MKKTTVTALVIASSLSLGLAGCSSGSSPTKPTASAKAAAASEQEWRVAVAQCMRGKGHDFPDPDPSGDGQQLKIDSDGDKWAADYQACNDETTSKLGERPVSEKQKKEAKAFQEKRLAYNDCMRKKGYTFTDPDPDNAFESSMAVGKDEKGKDIAPADEKACGPLE